VASLAPITTTPADIDSSTVQHKPTMSSREGKKRASEDSGDQPSPKKANATSRAVIDIQATSATWSPPDARLNRPEKTVSSLEDGNLRGGNFVLDCEGNATTLSFAFEKDENIYGLTAGHLADVGDAVFVFLLSSKTPNDFDEGESYEMVEAGAVVSKNVETDSLIFEINNPYMDGKVDALKLVRGYGLHDRSVILPEPSTTPTLVDPSKKVVVHGAMRRGESARVKVPYKSTPGQVSKVGDVGIESVGDDGARPPTSGGDCGSLYVTDAGRAIAMHHCLTGQAAPFVSYGIPLAHIMAKHSLLGGQEESVAESQQRKKSPAVESRNLAKFEVKVSKKVPAVGVDGTEEADAFEDPNFLRILDVRVSNKVAPTRSKEGA
jgi:hypothetical protein